MPLSSTTEAEPSPPLSVPVIAPYARPGTSPARIVGSGRRQRGLTKPLVGVFVPVLVAAVQQVEQNGAGHDRHADIAHRKAPAARAQPVRHPRGRIQPERRAAREHQRIDLLHQLVRRQKVGLAAAGRAAHDMNGGGKRPLAQQHRGAGPHPRILGVADPKPRHIGNQIACTRFHRPPFIFV